MISSVAARCAGEQGAVAYWEFHDLLMINQRAWSNNNHLTIFEGYATELGLDLEQYQACMADNNYAAQIEEDMNTAIGRGIRSTPSFLVNNQPLVGAQPITTFQEAIAVISSGETFAEAEPTAAPRRAPDPVEIDLEDAAITYGNPEAPVVIVEYTDYQCPFCARHSAQTMPSILNSMVADGLVYYVIKDFPLDQLHPDARAASVAARCAGEQGFYPEMHDTLFLNQNQWGNLGDGIGGYFASIASGIGMDSSAFEACFESGRYDEVIQANLDEGLGFGVNGTPAFFIDGYPVSGAQPIELFEYAVALAVEGRLAEAYSDNPPPPPNSGNNQGQQGGAAIISEEGAYVVGFDDAPITIVEYTDFQCPFCARHLTDTYPLILENYIETGIVRYVYKDFPLQSIHPQATIAAEAARCAGDQGAWIEMHDLLFANQREWSIAEPTPVFVSYAESLELDTAVFQACVESRQYQAAVEADLQEGAGFGVTGTPTFFFNGLMLAGAQPFDVFEQAIGQLLEEQGN